MNPTSPQPSPDGDHAAAHGAIRANPAEAPAQGSRPLSLEDVLEAGKDSLRLSLDLVSGSEIDFETLDDAVHQTRQAVGASGEEPRTDAGTIDLAAPRVHSEFDDAVGELEAFVRSLESSAESPRFDAFDEYAAFENTSILLHQFDLARSRDLDDWSRALSVCTKGLDPAGVAALILEATRDTAEQRPCEEFDAWMESLIPILRRTVPNLSDRLAAFAVEASPHGREVLWPFVVDELLVTLKGRREGPDPRVHDLDAVALERAIERLCALPAIARGRVAPGMLSISQSFAHPLVLRLMQSPARHVIGPVLLGAFRDTLPKDPGIGFCVLAMRQYEESLGWLLATQLESPGVPVHPDVQRSAAWLLVSVLDSMPTERREETWVAGALYWLGERDSLDDAESQRSGTADLLRSVVAERNGLRRSWNKECRRAAKAALAQGEFE